jgi:hypothetical protein
MERKREGWKREKGKRGGEDNRGKRWCGKGPKRRKEVCGEEIRGREKNEKGKKERTGESREVNARREGIK